MQLPGLWRARIAVGMVSVALAGALLTSGPAQAASGEEAKVLALANGLRASVGAPPLTFDENLASVSRAWAARMAAAGTISHNTSLTTQVTGWSKISENVGMGPTIEVVHNALVNSPSHHANLVDREVTLMGIGVVTAGNTVFIVQNFMKPSGAVAPKAAPAVTSPPATAPPTTKAPAKAAPATRPPVPTTVAPAPAPVAPTAAPAPVAAAPEAPAPSPWLSLALEVTRTWERLTP